MHSLPLIPSMLLACTLGAGVNTFQPPERSPNVLLILSDDQGWGEVSYYGNPYVRTPAIDSIAQDGAAFDHFYVNPSCAPTRAALLTGRHAPRTGVSGVTRTRETMFADEITLAQLFREAGYTTGCFGKWHNGAHYPHHPNAKGFDVFWGSPEGIWFDYFDAEMVHQTEPVRTEGFITDVLTDLAIDFMREAVDKGQPFFCYLPYNAPHTPALAPDAYYDRFRNRGLGEETSAIYGMIENMDDNIGRLLQTLDELGIADDTLVIFMTDNGPDALRINAGLRGRKGGFFEGGVRVPCFVRWPGHIPPGLSISEPAAHYDWLPTFNTLCSLGELPDVTLDGRDLTPLLTGSRELWPDRLIYLFDRNLMDPPESTRGVVITEQWRALRGRDGVWMLFDILKDPRQRFDLADRYPWVVDTLAASFEEALLDVYPDGPLAQPPIPVGHASAPRVHLFANEATLSPASGEGIRYSFAAGYPKHWITGWTSPDAHCEWFLEVVEAGDYEAVLYYTLEPENTGVAAVLVADSDSLAFSVEEAFDPDLYPVSWRVQREADKYADKPWKPLHLGSIRLKPGQQTLRLEIAEMPGNKAMDLKRIELHRSP